MRSAAPSYNHFAVLRFLTASWLALPLCAAVPSNLLLLKRSNPLNIDWDPAPPPELGPPLSATAIRDPAFLPAQIGGIVGSYALSLVLVALILLALSRTRREHLRASELPEQERNVIQFNPFPAPFGLQSEEEYKKGLQNGEVPRSAHIKNFSLPSNGPLSPSKSGPLSPAKSQHSVFTISSLTSTVLAAGADLSVDQTVVQADRNMAQSQLEDMYKYVMEQEEARAAGREYEGPPLPSPSIRSGPQSPVSPGMRRERNKPAGLNLAREERTQSRSSSLLSFLRSPRRSKNPQGMSISSPIITPMSATFPPQEDQEMNAMPSRHYSAVPPPVPSDLPFRRAANGLPTPEMSPTTNQSIGERIDAALNRPPTSGGRSTREDRAASHARDVSAGTSGENSDAEPVSAVSEKSTSGLVGLPTSPKPGVNRFPSLDSLPSLPSSPKPGSTFSRSNAPSAIRAGGALPLRAYEPSLASPSAASHQSTKQTVFTRAQGPLSPGMMTGMRTPWTGAPVPYTPYQPFSPVVPITPSLVTRADRKRMRKFEPKTPTVEMVRGEDDVW
ncbi:hypothetical protein B0T25DRAFT_259219 [Lasiosphaeria hispida]|uniref:Uncharacterized protein n=1 Tax=Lasiosphaeria hispida TaxID=260671 RepID=A0AAJ0HGD3_9PEZI|nr:hypothetical protein B0T25DRAFT_259219 [Lasiosphaeria hispida]